MVLFLLSSCTLLGTVFEYACIGSVHKLQSIELPGGVPRYMQDTAGYDPKPADEERAKAKFGSCMEDCGKECLDRIPKLKNDIVSQLKRL